VAFPLRALGEDDQGVVGGVALLVVDEQEMSLSRLTCARDGAADVGDVGGIERGEAGIAAEDAEDADALVEPTVVRWRLMALSARVMAVEKPMQYSVLRTSLSMVLGMAMTLTPSLSRRAA